MLLVLVAFGYLSLKPAVGTDIGMYEEKLPFKIILPS